MSSVLDSGQDPLRSQSGATASIRDSLRDLGAQLSLLNHHVGAQLELKDSDIQCLDLIDRHRPLSPSALARLAGLHPATMTGVLDRLERGGWVARERDPADRRAVTLRTLRDRRSELLGLYSGMNNAVRKICADYEETELTLVAVFLERIAAAGRAANADLSTPGQSQAG